jgi:hypothetical protein
LKSASILRPVPLNLLKKFMPIIYKLPPQKHANVPPQFLLGEISMNGSSSKIVRLSIEQAFEAALPSLHSRIQSLPVETQSVATECAEGLRLCIMEQAEAAGPDPTFQEGLIRLIFGHADPKLVEALREFVELVNAYLMEARNTILPPRRRLES